MRKAPPCALRYAARARSRSFENSPPPSSTTECPHLLRSHEKPDPVCFINNLAGRIRFWLDFPGTHRIERCYQLAQHRRWRDWNIVSSQYGFHLRGKCSQPANRLAVRIQVCLRPEKPDRRRIVGIAREQQPMRAVE